MKQLAAEPPITVINSRANWPVIGFIADTLDQFPSNQGLGEIPPAVITAQFTSLVPAPNIQVCGNQSADSTADNCTGGYGKQKAV